MSQSIENMKGNWPDFNHEICDFVDYHKLRTCNVNAYININHQESSANDDSLTIQLELFPELEIDKSDLDSLNKQSVI